MGRGDKAYLLHHLLRESAGKRPERAAIGASGSVATYAELFHAGAAFAARLREMGVAKGDRVGLCLGKGTEAVKSLMGILMAGGTCVPVDPSSPPPRVAAILRQCGVRHLVTTAGILDGLLGLEEGVDPVEFAILSGPDGKTADDGRAALKIAALASLFDGPPLAGGDEGVADTSPAYILHTSGSTGSPKGVVISHLNAMTFVRAAAGYFPLSEEDRFCSHAPLHFDLSIFDLFTAFRVGAQVVPVPESLSIFPVRLAQFIARERITVWNSVASVGTLLAQRGRVKETGLDAVRLFLFSGDVLAQRDLKVLMEAMPNASFFNVYGQTEANSSTCYPVREVPDDPDWRIPIGKPLPNFEVFALDDEGRTVERPGQTGEFFVNSSTVALGYWGDRQRTDEVFLQDPRGGKAKTVCFRTGDVVTLDHNGDFVFLGRKDNMVKVRGYRVQLEEIETVLANHEAVEEAAAVACPDAILGNRIFSFARIADGMAVREEELKERCAELLPAYMVPEQVLIVPDFPRTSTGKIDRKELLRNLAGKRAVAATRGTRAS